MHLIFGYNAGAGALNALIDVGHKMISPSTYKCDLCTLTHGTFRERKAWKRFRESTSLTLTFLHKDEFETQFEDRFSYPVVLRVEGSLEVLISTEDLSSMAGPEELIAKITERAT